MTEPTNTQVEPIVPSDKTYTQAELDAIVAEKIEKELAGIKANRDALLEEKKEQQRLAQEAEEKKRIAELEIAKKNGDWQSIEEDYKRQLREAIEAKEKIKQDFDSTVNQLTVGALASDIANELAKPSLKRYLRSDVEKRLYRDADGNIRVKDKNGTPTASTIEDLKLELKNDPDYQDIILINNSSGGGATGGGFGGGATKKPSEYTAEERVELLNTNPALFKQLFK